MLKFRADRANAAAVEKETLTAGRVGLQIEFEFGSEWAGLSKTAVFDGAKTVDVFLEEDRCVVPWEALTKSGITLRVGVFGALPDGTVVLPTVWASFGVIQPGAALGGEDPTEPTTTSVAYAVDLAEQAMAAAEAVGNPYLLDLTDSPIGQIVVHNDGVNRCTVHVFSPDEETLAALEDAAKNDQRVIMRLATSSTGYFNIPLLPVFMHTSAKDSFAFVSPMSDQDAALAAMVGSLSPASSTVGGQHCYTRTTVLIKSGQLEVSFYETYTDPASWFGTQAEYEALESYDEYRTYNILEVLP